MKSRLAGGTGNDHAIYQKIKPICYKNDKAERQVCFIPVAKKLDFYQWTLDWTLALARAILPLASKQRVLGGPL